MNEMEIRSELTNIFRLRINVGCRLTVDFVCLPLFYSIR